MGEGPFFQSLATIMVVAGLVAVLFSRFKWPKAIGYILAGVLLNGHTWGGAWLADESSVQTIGQLGVVFLMFTMGLEFSVSSMKKIGNVALPTAILDTVVMVWLGFTIGRSVFGWETIPSLFLGAAICDSATTLLAKVIGEMRWNDRPFVKYVLGSSVCEDIVCIGIIALVSGVASGKGVSVVSIGMSLGGVALFFGATLFFGLVLVPKGLNSVARRYDDESLLLFLLGCCFFVAYIAYKLDFSLALGAFLVGILGASSQARTRIHEMVSPLRSMFSAVFFVSIGLMVDPMGCVKHLPAILLLSAVVILGKFLNCFWATLLTGAENLKTSVQVGFSMAQIGEFAFMIALLYHAYCVKHASWFPGWSTEDPVLPIVVGVTLLTTVLNPVMIRFSDRAGDFAERHCPVKFKGMLATYRSFLLRYRAAGAKDGEASSRREIFRLAFVGVLQFTVSLIFVGLNNYDWSSHSAFFEAHKQIIFCLAMNVVLITILPYVFGQAQRLGDRIASVATGGGSSHALLAMRNLARLVAIALVMALDILEISMINVNLAPEQPWARLALGVAFFCAAGFGWRHFSRAAHRAADNFSEALAADETFAAAKPKVTFSVPEESVDTIVVPKGSAAVGATVGALNIRAKTGVIVVSVERRGKPIQHIGADFAFAAGDRLTVIGDTAQRKALVHLLSSGGALAPAGKTLTP